MLLENLGEEGNKVRPEYPGERFANTTVAGFITYLGLLLVPKNRDPLMSLKTENGDVKGHNKRRRNRILGEKKQVGLCLSYDDHFHTLKNEVRLSFICS